MSKFSSSNSCWAFLCQLLSNSLFLEFQAQDDGFWKTVGGSLSGMRAHCHSKMPETVANKGYEEFLYLLKIVCIFMATINPPYLAVCTGTTQRPGKWRTKPERPGWFGSPWLRDLMYPWFRFGHGHQRPARNLRQCFWGLGGPRGGGRGYFHGLVTRISDFSELLTRESDIWPKWYFKKLYFMNSVVIVLRAGDRLKLGNTQYLIQYLVFDA